MAVVAALALAVELNEPSWSLPSWRRTGCERLKKAAEAAAAEEVAAMAVDIKEGTNGVESLE